MVEFSDIKWPMEYTELTRIEELLHCRICYEYINTSVITPCSHNYCSICIRKFLNYKTQCPICFENIYEKDLHANRILDEFMELYSSVKHKLLTCIKGARVKEADQSPMIRTPVKQDKVERVAASYSSFETPKKLFRNKSEPTPKGSSYKEPCDGTRLSKTPLKMVVPSPSTSQNNSPRISSLFMPISVEKRKPEISVKRVPCPVCDIEISETNINKHLDDCLKRQRSMSPPKASTSSLEPIPKYVVYLMKESELRKLLKKYGLSTAGGRKALEKRLQKFSILYNAERDKLVPKSVEELVRQCESEEIAEKNIVKPNPLDYVLNIDRKTDSDAIEKAQKQYLERNKDDYQKLIESINNREKRRGKTGRCLFSREFDEDSGAATSSLSRTMSQSIFNESDERNETNSSSAADLSQYLPADSDSTNASYPLQHYSREDPMKYLALEISSDAHASPIKLEPRSPSRSTTPIIDKIKSEAILESENSLDRITSSNPSSSSLMFSFSSKNSASLGETERVNTPNELINNIFDASTEDNLSDSFTNDGTRINVNKKAKKLVMKRSKVDAGCQSTDSETDVEPSFRSVGRKTTKIQKHRYKNGAKTSVPKDNGSLYKEARVEEPPTDSAALSCIGVSNFSQERNNKENSQISIADDDKLGARRSSRKRNHVSYSMNLLKNARVSKKSKKGKKALDEQGGNVVVETNAKENQETLGENKGQIDAEGKCESADWPVNMPKRSLRIRRKC